MDVMVLDDPAAEAARRIAATAGAGGHIALAGGSTPRAAYAQAAQLLHDWKAATLWFGDERAVAPDDERSNFGMARAALLDHITGAAPTVQRIEGERGHEAAAADYADRLRATFGDDITASYGKPINLQPVRKTIAGRGIDTVIIGLAAVQQPKGPEKILKDLGYPPK